MHITGTYHDYSPDELRIFAGRDDIEAWNEQEFLYEAFPTARGVLYVGERDGFLDFWYQSDLNHCGYDGRSYDIRLVDGRNVTLEGRYASDPDAVHTITRRHQPIRAVVTDELGGFSLDAHITPALCQELWRQFPPPSGRPLDAYTAIGGDPADLAANGHQTTAPPPRLEVGATLYGYCDGWFSWGRYYDKRVEAIGPDWVVAREIPGAPR